MDYSGLKLVLKTMNTNVCEADEKIRMAYELKNDWKSIADWQKEMAIAHIGFNTNGQKIAQSYINIMMDDSECEDCDKGKLSVYEEWMNDIVSKVSDVQSMINLYK